MNQQPEHIVIGRRGRLLRTLIIAVGRLFYPRTLQIGQLPTGPLILAANHPNGLLDGMALLLTITRPIAFLAKSTFYANPLMRLVLQAVGAVPVYRPADSGKPGGPPAGGDANALTFAAARALLAQGGMLAVFPEGTPNAGPQLLPLKTGIARIGLGAEAQAGWRLGLRIVPVGLWFEAQARAGTAALVLIGEPIVVTEFQAAYQHNQEAAIRALTAHLQESLAATVAEAWQAGADCGPTAGPTWQHARASVRGMGWAHTSARVLLLALGALPALVGHLAALPGLAIAWLILQLLARRHRATVGTIQLIGLVAGLLLGWAIIGVSAGLLCGWQLGVLALIGGPLAGAIGLRWRRAMDDRR